MNEEELRELYRIIVQAQKDLKEGRSAAARMQQTMALRSLRARIKHFEMMEKRAKWKGL